jgi:hypothetical protein
LSLSAQKQLLQLLHGIKITAQAPQNSFADGSSSTVSSLYRPA